jgi:flagellar biosynthesis protein FliQ
MSTSDAVDLVRNAAVMALVIGAPLLFAGLLIGLLVSLFQALTHIQDQTVSTVPKLVAMVLAMLVCLPWIADRMLEYSRDVIRDIPSHMRSSE